IDKEAEEARDQRRMRARRTALIFGRFAAEHLNDLFGARHDAARHIVLAEQRQDPLLDDELRHCVGKLALQPIADLDPHLALGRRDDQQDAVVLSLLADLPGTAETHAVVLDAASFERFDRDDHELTRGLRFEIRKLARQEGTRSWAEY